MQPQVTQTPVMHLRVGYELVYSCPQPVPMILLVNVHYSRASDIIVPDHLTTVPSVPITAYRDSFGNWCNRLVAPAGRLSLKAACAVRESSSLECIAHNKAQHSVV